MVEFSKDHIAVTDLWAYRSQKKPLTPDQVTHLCACNDCQSLLGICQLSDTIEEVGRLRIGQPKRGGISKWVTTEEYSHLRICDNCVTVLWMCYASSSFEELQQVLSKYGKAD